MMNAADIAPLSERAAAGGDSVASETLGLRSAEGQGVARGAAKALDDLRRAAADEQANGRSGTATAALERVEAALRGPPPGA